MKRVLTIADIMVLELVDAGKTGFMSTNTVFLRKVFINCVKRKVMKNSDYNWVNRVLSGVDRSEGFIKSKYKNRSVYTFKKGKE